jgi:ferrous iron transport protein B
VICVIDSCNLERNLYLTSQLIDLGIPLVLALNMSDLAEKQGIRIKRELLARLVDQPVVSISAATGERLDELKQAIKSQLEKRKVSREALAWARENPAFLEAAEQIGQLEPGERLTGGGPTLLGAFILSGACEARGLETRELSNQLRISLQERGIDSYSYEASARYHAINEMTHRVCASNPGDHQELSERIDKLLTSRITGSLAFLFVMFALFQSIFVGAAPLMDLIESTIKNLGEWLAESLPAGEFRDLLINGIIAGVGSVLVFVPQIAILFFLLGLLEDSGYLCRAAFLMDRLMRRVGLQGRAFIPLLSSFACAIPGILSTRSIPSFTDRLTTILIAPLMSCSARLPVYAVLIGAFVPAGRYFGVISPQGLVLLGMYLLGIAGAVMVSALLRGTLLRGEPSLFVMEMPPFRRPSLKLILRDVQDRVLLFIKSAGTVILACSIVLWFLASYPNQDVEKSYAGMIGKTIEPAIQPLGFDWEIGVGILASFAAREVFVSSLATVYKIEGDEDPSDSLIDLLKERREQGRFSTATAFSLMVFFVFACQCMSTLAVCRRETGGWAWPAFMFSYMTALAYAASWITYRLVLAWS